MDIEIFDSEIVKSKNQSNQNNLVMDSNKSDSNLKVFSNLPSKLENLPNKEIDFEIKTETNKSIVENNLNNREAKVSKWRIKADIDNNNFLIPVS